MIPSSPRQVYQALRPLIDDLYSKLGGSSSTSSATRYAFVYQPGGVPGPNVFVTQASVQAAMAAVRGPKLLELDTTFAPVPGSMTLTGAWNLTDVTLVGTPLSNTIGQPTVTFDVGATIVADNLTIDGNLIVQNNGTTVWTTTNHGIVVQTLSLRGNSQLLGTAGAPFISVPAGSIFVNNCDTGGVGDGTHAVINVIAGGTLVTNAFVDGYSANAVSGAGTWAFNQYRAGLINFPQGIVPTVTYFDLPQAIGEANTAGAVGPAAPVVFTSTGTIQREASGLVRGSACAVVTGAGVGAAITFDVLRNPGGVVIATQTIDGGSTHTQCTLPVFDTLPDEAAHTYAIRVTQGATALTIPTGQARIALSELT